MHECVVCMLYVRRACGLCVVCAVCTVGIHVGALVHAACYMFCKLSVLHELCMHVGSFCTCVHFAHMCYVWVCVAVDMPCVQCVSTLGVQMC